MPNAAAGLSELQKIDAARCDDWAADTVSPLSIDDGFLGEKSGDTLLLAVEAEIMRRPKPGTLGYTARYLAHLRTDARGDDIRWYRQFQHDALAEHTRAIRGVLPIELEDTARIEPGVVAMLGRQHGIAPKRGQIGNNRPPGPEMTDDPNAARAAQKLGIMVSALSTNPILELLLGRT